MTPTRLRLTRTFTLAEWQKFIVRQRRNFSREDALGRFPPLVPFDNFRDHVAAKEVESREVLKNAIDRYASEHRWRIDFPNKYFLRMRIANAVTVTEALVTANRSLSCAKNRRFSLRSLLLWSLFEAWKWPEHRDWQENALIGDWRQLLRNCGRDWLYSVWIKGESDLPEEFRIAKLMVRFEKEHEQEGLKFFKCFLTLRNGRLYSALFEGVAEPTYAELERLMIHRPECFRWESY